MDQDTPGVQDCTPTVFSPEEVAERSVQARTDLSLVTSAAAKNVDGIRELRDVLILSQDPNATVLVLPSDELLDSAQHQARAIEMTLESLDPILQDRLKDRFEHVTADLRAVIKPLSELPPMSKLHTTCQRLLSVKYDLDKLSQEDRERLFLIAGAKDAVDRATNTFDGLRLVLNRISDSHENLLGRFLAVRSGYDNAYVAQPLNAPSVTLTPLTKSAQLVVSAFPPVLSLQRWLWTDINPDIGDFIERQDIVSEQLLSTGFTTIPAKSMVQQLDDVDPLALTQLITTLVSTNHFTRLDDLIEEVRDVADEAVDLVEEIVEDDGSRLATLPMDVRAKLLTNMTQQFNVIILNLGNLVAAIMAHCDAQQALTATLVEAQLS